MKESENSAASGMKQNLIVRLFKYLGRRVASLFQPEEVEVTFKVDGNRTHYTYKVIEHKPVAF